MPMRCHWLALAVLGACQFSAGQRASSDASAGTADVPEIDAPPVLIDAPVTSPDASPDALVTGPKVRSIDITDAQVSAGPHVDFPLLVSISATWLKSTGNGGDVARLDGFDIYFSADQLGVTRLAHEVESYSATNGELVAWVKIPALAATTVLYLHYGDTTITTNQAMPTAVWSSSYALVAHMAGGGDSTGVSTINGILTQATGKIGQGRSFDGSATDANAGSLTAIDDIFSGGGSVEGWFYALDFGESGFGRLFDKGFDNGYAIYVDNSNTTNAVTFYAGTSAGNGFALWATPSIATVLNTWHHYAVQIDSANPTGGPQLYLDGAAVTPNELDPAVGTLVSDANQDLHLGNNSSGSRTFHGTLDELRQSTVMRSAGWMLTQYRNQSDPATFYTVSAPL